MSHQRDFTGIEVVDNYHQRKIHDLEKLQVDFIIKLIERERKSTNEMRDILDVGCGSGGFTKHLATHFGRAIGIDVSSDQIRKAKEMDQGNNVEFRVGTAEDLPVASNSIDIITAIFALHFMDVEKLEKECRRVLRPGGMAIFYGDCLSNITATGNEQLSDTADQIKEMYAKYSKIAEETSHPEFHLIDRYRTLYERIIWPEKNFVETSLTDIVLSLHDFYHHLRSIPFYRTRGKACGVPLDEYVETVKSMWTKNESDEEHIMLRVSNRAFAIILSK